MKNCHIVVFYTLNIFLVVAGLLMLTIGLIIQLVPQIHGIALSLAPELTKQQLGFISIMFLGVGSFIFLISFVGICGVITETKCLLNLYVIFMVLLIAAQITIAVLSLVYGRKGYDEQIDVYFGEIVKNYDEKIEAAQAIVDTIQQYLDCCGNDSPLDYNSTKLFGKVPKSCCLPLVKIQVCQNGTVPINERRIFFHDLGCKQKMNEFIKTNSVYVTIGFFISVFIMITSVSFVCYFHKKKVL